jgi:RHS repeat-associated protein
MRKRASMILRNTVAFLLAVTLTAPLFAQDRFIPASDSDPVMGRYLVLFAGDDPADDESTADAIARTYGARIEPYADSSVRGAVMHMRPAQARLLSEDLRVSRVEEQPLSDDGAPQAPQLAAAAPAHRAAGADASFSPVTTAETPIWSSGAYEYDDAGNIKAIGNDDYRYDGVGRLVYATAFTPGNVNNIQSYGYDEFGNMILRVTDPHGSFPNAESYPVNAATNQLTSAQYDDTGNQTTIEPNGGVLAYDAAGMLMTLTAGNNKLAYVYDANDERIVTVELVNGNESRHRYTLRGSDNKVARELTLEPLTMNWHLVKDYVHRGGALMASFASPTATAPDRHYHLDHLGSTRLITDASGGAVARMTYWPFGLETPGSTSTPGDRLKFTGHERDTDGAAAAFNLDYMHARYYNGGTSRFMAVDPLPGEVTAPQSWNRYVYAQNNPLKFVDPDGRSATLAGGLIGGVLGGGIALVQGRSWREVGAAAAGGAVAGAMMGSVIDTGGASLGVMVAAGAMSGAAGAMTENVVLGRPHTLGNVGEGAVNGTAGVMLGASIGPAMEAVAARLGGFSRGSVAEMSGMLRTAAGGKGNFGIGSGSARQADAMGKAWVGPSYTIASDGKTLISADGLRQYRPPSYKPSLKKVQANYESRLKDEGRWQANGHLDVR